MPMEKVEEVLAEKREVLVAPLWTWARLPESLRRSAQLQIYWCVEMSLFIMRDARMDGGRQGFGNASRCVMQ